MTPGAAAATKEVAAMPRPLVQVPPGGRPNWERRYFDLHSELHTPETGTVPSSTETGLVHQSWKGDNDWCCCPGKEKSIGAEAVQRDMKNPHKFLTPAAVTRETEGHAAVRTGFASPVGMTRGIETPAAVTTGTASSGRALMGHLSSDWLL